MSRPISVSFLIFVLQPSWLDYAYQRKETVIETKNWCSFSEKCAVIPRRISRYSLEHNTRQNHLVLWYGPLCPAKTISGLPCINIRNYCLKGLFKINYQELFFATINCHKWTGNVLESPCACIISVVLEGSGQPALNVINAAAASSTCIRMISQRYESGTISTPEGGAVVNGDLLNSNKAFNHENGNNDEQDV